MHGRFAVLALVAACTSEPASPTPNAPLLPVDTLPSQLNAVERQTVTESNAFGLALFRRVSARKAGENVFISPYSAAVALGMTLNGAAGTTADGMATTLGFAGQSLSQIDAAYRSLGQRLAQADTSVRFTSANSIWYNRDFPFHQTFFDTAASYFGAQVTGLNFADEASSLARINGWASQQTDGKIDKVLDRIRAADQAMFLLNALYFKADWSSPFDSRQTQKAAFAKADGGTQSVDMMTVRRVVPMWRGPNATAIELPYGNGAFRMVILMPNAGTSLDNYVGTLDAARWQQAIDSLRMSDVQLYVPRFAMKYEDEWKDVLSAMGMQVAFTPGQADFTRMSPRGRELFIEFVKQNTFIGVNEKGTEAGAVTTVGIGVVSLPPDVRIDRAFAFAIRERTTGAILFAGKLSQVPTGS